MLSRFDTIPVHDGRTDRQYSYVQGSFKDQFRTAQDSNFMASAEREPITGSGGGVPSGGPGGLAPGGGSGGEAP